MNTVEKFEQWCVVEIMGHKRFAGHVTEQAVGGTSFVRIEIPEVTTDGGQKLPAFTKLFGAASIYCISPCTEETARAFAKTIRAEGFALYEAPRLPAPKPAPERDPEWDADDDELADSFGGGPLRTNIVCNCGDREVCDTCQGIAKHAVEYETDEIPDGF